MPNSSPTRLCPAQQRAFDSLSAGVQVGSILRLRSGCGRGKTTILRELHQQVGGAFLNMKDFVEASAKNHPLALEETLYRLLLDALRAHPVVIMDDLHLLDLYSAGCHFYPRSGYFNSIMMGLCTYALEAGKKLIISTHDHIAEAAEQRSYSFGIERFKVEDYAALVATFRGAPAPQLDFEKIFRFAPKLNAHQLKAACQWLVNYKELGTDLFIEYLRSQRLASNVDLGEVQTVDLKDLKGVNDVLRNLEINIVLPLQNDELASHLRLRSKRGVLLYGPPGTGKTTVGRALAHRLKGKFFLIDGTFIAGTDGFYQRINQVFEAAKDNAPSVIFIDDADAIFEDGEERGLYRYLLTMIDGLESESAGRVCVMMTAMDVAHLPPALVRSGRVELWLEMKLPDPQARTDILSDHLKNLPDELRQVDVARLISATDGFTGADLKRLVEDGKAIYAYDKSRGEELLPTTDYFMRAVEAVKENKQHYAAAEAQALLQPKSPMAGFMRSFVTSHVINQGSDDD
ncbi:MAG TPA: ATP-binding protein [Candidatus Binatia bacterium]|jgi:transitional endoplasmic reticulum ATPase|nr:ATP-binding protein [Candidatus Binatia bacterium]